MANQYTTLALIEAETGSSEITSSTTPTSSEVTTWIEEISAEIEVMTGEVFTSTVVSSSFIDYDGNNSLLIERFPLISVSEIRYNKQNVTSSTTEWVTLEEGYGKNYIVYTDTGEIEFINGNGATNTLIPKAGKKKLCVSYVYGYNNTPLEVQRLATVMAARRLINALVNSQANTEGGEVTVGPITVKDPSSFNLNQIKSLDNEIKDLRARIGRDFQTFRGSRVY